LLPGITDTVTGNDSSASSSSNSRFSPASSMITATRDFLALLNFVMLLTEYETSKDGLVIVCVEGFRENEKE
jgi:hypothetical protein